MGSIMTDAMRVRSSKSCAIALDKQLNLTIIYGDEVIETDSQLLRRQIADPVGSGSLVRA